MTDRRTASVLLPAVLLAAVALSACGNGVGVPEAGAPTGSPRLLPPLTSPTEPGSTREVLPPQPSVGWAGEDRLAVTTHGSSSCPTAAGAPVATGPQEVRIEVTRLFPDRDPCTADMAVFTTEVALPGGVSDAEPVTVHLRYEDGDEQRVVLPPAGQ